MQTNPTVSPLAHQVAKPVRCDGVQARARLLIEALRLFSEHGFAKTSIRAIAQAAEVNVSAISYYFGDKEGLYRCAITEPFLSCDPLANVAAFSAPELTLEQALRQFYTQLLTPIEQGAIMRDCLRLHMREMLEPTGLWQQQIEQQIVPTHRALADLVRHHIGMSAPADEGIHRITLAITAMPVHLMMAGDVVMAINPDLLNRSDAVPAAVNTFVRYAMALVDSERKLRDSPRPP